MLDIAILDDEQIYLEATASMIKEYRDAHSELDISLHIFTSPYDLLGSVDTFDMYLLDVVMPNMTGIEVATVLREKRVESPIVFLTSTREFAVESYSVGAFNYLIKPIDKKKLFEVLDKAFDEVGVKRASFISAKTADGVELVPFNKIVYIEFLDRRVCYHMTNGDLILC
ncbi:MAG: response regulator transcription factor, partial [Clostridia bacterium]|nr:response regulator transcription factor [Clostridia bacterium]